VLPGIRVTGIDCHIGSQVTEIAPYLDATDRLLDLIEQVEADGIPIHHIDFGGGLGIAPCHQRPEAPLVWDVVGPVCESGDWLGRDRALAVQPGDTLAVLSAGAYGMAMASNYNTRPRAAEVMVDADQATLIRRRETAAELFSHEIVTA
jgi:diaminopimelate decarboxylase